MKIGLTYDLRADYRAEGLPEEATAELDSAVTIEGIAGALAGLGFEVTRIGGLKPLMVRLLAGERWDMVFNIAEGLFGLARESQVPALLDAFRIPYTFSDPLVLGLALHKGMAKHVARDQGVPTAPFAVIASPADLAAARDLPYPLFGKPVAEGSSKGVTPQSRIERPEQLLPLCEMLWRRFAQPVLVEPYLPGREFTVGIVGTGASARAIGVLEVEVRPGAEPGIYSYDNKEDFERCIAYRLVKDTAAERAAAVGLAAWIALDCRDGGRVDLRADASGAPLFMEANPLAGLNPERSDLVFLARDIGWSYDALIGRIVASALARNGLAEAAPAPARALLGTLGQAA